MSEITQQVGTLIREARKAKGLTQKELGEKLGVTESAVNRYENGKVNMSLNALKKLADTIGAVLDIDLRYE